MTPQYLETEDIRFLQSELLFRMAIQNIVILINAIAFNISAIIQIIHNQNAALISLYFTLFCGFMAAIWCHHGTRQAQIKSYLLIVQDRHGIAESWESWLPRHRFTGILGSRWFISTKATFIISAYATCALALFLDRSFMAFPATMLSLCGAVVITVLLLINPKEGLSPPNRMS